MGGFTRTVHRCRVGLFNFFGKLQVFKYVRWLVDRCWFWHWLGCRYRLGPAGRAGCFLLDWRRLNFVGRCAVYTFITLWSRNRRDIPLGRNIVENLFITVEQIVETPHRRGWYHQRRCATGAIDALTGLLIVGFDLLQTFGTIKLNHTSRYQRNRRAGFQTVAFR